MKVLKVLAVVVLLLGGTIGALYMVWRPDDAAFRAQGWFDDAAKATAAAKAAGQPLLVKVGKHA